MSYLNIYGTGGVVFQDLINQGQYIYFPTAIVNISKQKIKKRLTGNKGKLIERHKGWRLFFTVTIQNYNETDYINIIKLLNNISVMTNQSGRDSNLYFFPKVNSYYEGFYNDYPSYRVVMTDLTISFKKIADNLLQGEILTISFPSYGLEKNLSVFTNRSLDGMIDDTDDIIVDNTDEQIGFFEES